MNSRLLLASTLTLLTTAGVAQAAGPFVALETSRQEQTFRPNYAFTNGSAALTYVDKSSDFAFGLRAGQVWALGDRFDVAGQLRFAHARNDWALQTPEPAQLSFRIPNTLAAGLVLGFSPTPAWRITAELAAGKGEVKELKRAPTASNYHFDEWVTHTAWALGVGHTLTDTLALSLEYRSTDYSSLTHTSSLPGSSAVVENIRDAPSVRDLALVLSYRF